MMKTTTKRILTLVCIIAMAITSVTVNNSTAKAASNGIVKGPNTVDEEDSFTTTLSSGETASIAVKNSILSIKVNSTSFTFKIGEIVSTTDAAVINENDGLLHILTLAGVYYVFDLRSGVQVVAYRNMSNGKYASSKNTNAYMVYGKSLISNSYFYELVTSNALSRELLMTRAEFDIIVGGGDPSVDPVPTTIPTPTAIPTVAPIVTSTPATVIPTSTPDVLVEFNFDFWWKQYTSGIINWNQFSEMMWKSNWTSKTSATSTSTKYYFYDADGKLVKEETVTNEVSNTNGTENASASASTQGEATVKLESQGTGGGSGVITIKQATAKATTTSKTTSSKSRPFYFVRRHGKKVELMRRYKGKTGGFSIVLFDKKKATAKFNSHTYKKVRDVGYTQKSHQVVLLMKSGDIKILPTGKGTATKKYIVRTYKGSYDSLQNNVNNLTIRASAKGKKSLGLKNAKPVTK